MSNKRKRRPPKQRISKESSTVAVDQQTRDQWLRVVDELQAIPEPEPGSVLAQLADGDAVHDLDPALAFLRNQGAACLCTALNVTDCGRCTAPLTTIAPLARSALLCFSKIVAVCAPMVLQVRELGPARQLCHDNLVNMYLDQERLLEMGVQEGNSGKVWTSRGREVLRTRANDIRASLGEKEIPERPLRPSDTLVGEGVWIWDGQRKSAFLRDLVGAPKEEFEQRMQWAWHRASVVTHGGMTTQHASDGRGLQAMYVSPQVASNLLRTAVEMGLSAHHVLHALSDTDGAPPEFAWNSDGALPRSVPRT